MSFFFLKSPGTCFAKAANPLTAEERSASLLQSTPGFSLEPFTQCAGEGNPRA